MRTAEAWVLGYVLNSLWQVPLLLAAAWLAARVLRPLGAAAEHRVWVTALLLGSVLPAGYLPPWSWFSIRTWLERIGGSRGGNTHVSVVMGAATGAGAVHLPATLLSAAVLVYGAVCAWFLLRFAWRWTRLASLRREATELILTGDNARAWADCSVRFGVEGVAVASSPSLFAPVTLGFRSRLILLPERLTRDVADADLPVVIAHELAHIRRNDFVKNLLYELLTLPVSYHPAFQITRERVIETREMVCDEMAAVLTGRNPYARSLLRLASLLVAGMPARIPHAIGIFDAHTFERRIMRLTEKRAEVRSVRRLATLIACAALGIATCGSALALHLR
ncbi:MAG: M56 family metallopeptidase, partial [Acidobacteriaceae bacterium]